MKTPSVENWLQVRPEGLYVVPADLYIDPQRPVERAVVTHGHADHARPGQERVLATAETLAIMRHRMGAEGAPRAPQALRYGEALEIDGVRLRLAPAGHVLGSAQVVLEHGGCRVVVSGDYKRRRDPTCAPFEVVPCDVFITEATFGLPVFQHPADRDEMAKLLHSLQVFPESAHVVGCYALGKCQRLIMMLREAGWDGPIWLHGAQIGLCDLYRAHGVALGELRPATVADRESLRGGIVLAPPSAIQDRWARRLPDPVVCMASGWMQVRQRAKQRGVQLPLIVSDHADWPELQRTVIETGCAQLWVTHGQEEPLVHWARGQGIDARALYLLGLGEEEEAA